jgi:hypothetical protein
MRMTHLVYQNWHCLCNQTPLKGANSEWRLLQMKYAMQESGVHSGDALNHN